MTNIEEMSAHGEQEASGMNSQRWPRMAGQNWPGSERWGGCKAPASPAGQKKRDRKTTERGPRALTGVALYSS